MLISCFWGLAKKSYQKLWVQRKGRNNSACIMYNVYGTDGERARSVVCAPHFESDSMGMSSPTLLAVACTLSSCDMSCSGLYLSSNSYKNTVSHGKGSANFCCTPCMSVATVDMSLN